MLNELALFQPGYTLGLFLGQCGVPRVAWQIDPFGHSKEQARMFAQMGMDGLFFARADYRDKKQRRSNKTLQMIWDGGKASNVEEAIFTGMFSKHYNGPTGFCFDIRCEDDPIIDDPILEGYNVDEKVSYQFLKCKILSIHGQQQ